MNATMRSGFLLLVASAVLIAGGACSKPPRDDAPSAPAASANASPTSNASAPVDGRGAPTDFVSKQHHFSIRYPGGAQPSVQDLGKIDTAIGTVTEFSYYTGVGDTTYDVTVSVYPSGKLSPDTDGLLKVVHDTALKAPGASLVTEQRTSVKTSRGRDIQAHFIEVRMKEAHVFRVTCFFNNFGYSISAGGRFGDTTMRRETFDKFVESFQLLEDVAL